MSEWYKDWFNSKYYHILYKDRDLDEAKDFIQNLLKDLKLLPGSRILDLACGRGRHAIYLNQQGFKVLGVDLSEENISFASQFKNEHLQFKVHDMRSPLPNEEFDAVFNLFTSFAYFENPADNIKVLNAVASYLKKGGILLIDFFNVEKILDNICGQLELDIDNISFQITKHCDGRFIRKKIKVRDGEKQFCFEEVVLALKKDDLINMLEKTGFTCVAVYGDYNLSNFDPVKSDRLILKAELK